MIAAAWWQFLLDGLGKGVSALFDLIPSYGVAIILLTVAIRLVLLPLGLKQIRSMHAMQRIQPELKRLQTKYKGNRQKLNEEMMKLYKEHGVNPLSGCWPMLLQIPVLAALYSVLQYPQHPSHLPCDESALVRVADERVEGDEDDRFCVEPGSLRASIEAQLFGSHPEVAARYEDVEVGSTRFLSMNLLCSSIEAGRQATRQDAKETEGDPRSVVTVDCGRGIPTRIPYYLLAAAMVGTTYYQSKQMQKANPAGSAQQQTLTRIMPILFGVWGFIFPAGLVLYWTTSNAWQIGQQHFVLKAKREAEEEAARLGVKSQPPPSRSRRLSGGDGRGTGRSAAQAKGAKRPNPSKRPSGSSGSKGAPPKGGSSSVPPKQGRFSAWLERQEREQSRKLGRSTGESETAASGDGSGDAGDAGGSPTGGTNKGSSKPSSGGRPHGGDRKKRRKR